MVEWMAVKHGAKKLWVDFKNYWYIPVILVLLVLVYIFSRPATGQLIKVLKNANERRNREIAELERIHEAERKKIADAREEYVDDMQLADEKYSEALDALSEDKKKEVEHLIEQHKDDPEKLTEELSRLTGFRIRR